jgi:hypothetical protein
MVLGFWALLSFISCRIDDLIRRGLLYITHNKIYTHYIHSVLVQDFVSGWACCVNQYHYESRKRRVVMRLVHTTGKTWYKNLYQHTMYVISLSNISIKTNFKQITRVEIKLTNLYNTLGETTFCTWPHIICCSSFFCFAYVAYIDVFSPHSNDMTSWQNSSAEKISCIVAPFFYHHSVVIHLVSDRLLSLNSKENVQNVR